MCPNIYQKVDFFRFLLTVEQCTTTANVRYTVAGSCCKSPFLGAGGLSDFFHVGGGYALTLDDVQEWITSITTDDNSRDMQARYHAHHVTVWQPREGSQKWTPKIGPGAKVGSAPGERGGAEG